MFPANAGLRGSLYGNRSNTDVVFERNGIPFLKGDIFGAQLGYEASPVATFYESVATADARRWFIGAFGEVFYLGTLTDDFGTLNYIMQADRSAEVPQSLQVNVPLRTSGFALATAPVVETSDVNVAVDDYILLCNTSSGNIAATLPLRSSAPGAVFLIRKTDATNTLNINAHATDGGGTVASATAVSSVMVVNGAAGWAVAAITD